MNNNQSSLITTRKIAAIIVVGLFIYAQFGCNLIKKETSVGVSNANSATVAADQNTSANEKSGTPEICRNSYYPVGTNVERKYNIIYAKNALPKVEHTEKFTDFTNDTFVARNDYQTVTSTINWKCTADGLLATQFDNTIDIKKGGSSSVETLDSEGVSFPPDARWKTGEKWTTEYKIKETMKSADDKPTGSAEGAIKQDYEIVGAESVTVPAGTFQAMKVKSKINLDLIVKVSGMSIPAKTTVETTAWFAKDVGMVKSESAMGGVAAATTELTAYTGTK